MPTPVTPVVPSPGGISWANRPVATGAPKGFTLRNPSSLPQNRQLPAIPTTAPSSPPSGHVHLVQRPNVMNTPVAVSNNNTVGAVDTAKKVSNAGVGINYSSSMTSNNNASPVNTSYGGESMLERKSSGGHIPAPPEIVALNNTQIVNNNIQKFNAISSNSPRGVTTVTTTSNIYPSSAVSSPAMFIPNSPTKMISQSADADVGNSPWSSSHSQAQSNPKLGLGMTRGTPNGSASNTPNGSFLRNYYN